MLTFMSVLLGAACSCLLIAGVNVAAMLSARYVWRVSARWRSAPHSARAGSACCGSC